MLSVLFVGSFDRKSDEYDEFIEFCRQLGHGVAGRLKILICGSTPGTADYSIALGAFQRLDSLGTQIRDVPQVTLYHTKDDESEQFQSDIFLRFLKPDEKFSTVFRPFFAHQVAAFHQAVEDCDIVTLIGGDKNSAIIADIAIRKKKPILGFTAFAGVGKKSNQELKRVYELLGISEEKTETLHSRQMTDLRCASYLDLVSHVHDVNPWSSKSAWRRGARLVGVLLLLTLVCVGCILSAGYGLLEVNSMKYVALYLSCGAAGLVGGYASFLKQLDSPGDILLARAVPASGQGIAIGISFAVFAQTILEFVLTDQERISDLSFARLIIAFSGMTFSVAAFGIKGLKALGDVLGNRPGIT